MRRARPRRLSRLVTALGLLAAATMLALSAAPAASAAPARINGQGSSYVALAMQQWVADAQTSGLQVNYLPTGSPAGLTSFGQSLADFAGTEAEFSALSTQGVGDTRGYQYVPSVAGAVAVMYNVQDAAGRKVDYLHLTRRTIARIFTGDITTWSDPAITADNKGLVLPDQPINVVYRGGQSGTTGLFYDFVANVAPDVFGPWAQRNSFPTSVRIIQLDSSPQFVPKSQAFQGSDQIAQFIGSGQGLWSIGYDEFGYAKVYDVPAAWVENAAGQSVLPYAENISAALESAALRPDLSQELSGVYNSTNPIAYPISAYSYIVTQCTVSGDRPTCQGSYPNSGITETLARWLRYIACEGQVNMARIGYSPLPPNLSQEVANSVARLTGEPAEQLSAANCANPRFTGSVGDGGTPPVDPIADVDSIGGGATDLGADGGTGAAGGGAGKGTAVSSGGGSTDWRRASPVAYVGPSVASSSPIAVAGLVAVMVLPIVIGSLLARRRRSIGPVE
ncbi:MAG: phosphate ABC transporter substrate-binding protein [Actinobacteria bacterium]|nr:phosphate ABC transporter substrate-binding protein [Actinomycetota bacterium]